ncbi:DNA polymerase III subunit psi [Polynucleobacter sp. UK-Kesae-W10]|uniref:DNA polymerase III subunit psi n=1 Tax=Polynucleobacter sp. UK-Kesae-W10 TaxID=1819738 RepID=UPI001C0E3BAC|nr:DNA polymerase III subunit psi [Polynucleobacter sp. UK-Kesae-W10]MBU3577913.1 DNA polymerase III subunit psi [Polynucleobacter sp. UK-Kesae-W10]
MSNTHSSFLKEMGITEWTSRDAVPTSSVTVIEASPVNTEPSEPREPISRGQWWFFGSQPQGEAQILFQNIIRVLGLSSHDWSWKSANEDLSKLSLPDSGLPVVAFAFGGSVAQKITGERDPLPQLRETILALNTNGDEEIPVVATFDLAALASRTKDKALLWQDLLLAKSVLQNS